jgi:radical SAM superfamily enzyme YgiQ (UPF0313 family)
MKILLISPVKDSTVRTNKGLMMPQLALFIIEGLTPREHEVKIVEEESAVIDFEYECDLVGISCMTSNANRAYKVAAEFRKRGKTVVLGGVHPTILPDEALQHADSVVIGEAEGVWEKLLADFQNNNLQRTYHEQEPDIARYIPKNFAALKSNRLFRIVPIMTTRGCPYNCDFCCVSNLFGKKIRHIPVENVIKDIQNSGARNFIFLDDNIIGHPKYAKELFKAIKPLKIGWIGQASISFTHDEELMKLAAESGCHALFIGLESVCEKELENMRKSLNNLTELESALKKIRKMGILVHASMIFGFDNDTRETFLQTVRFLKKNRVSTVSFNVLTPYPGTKVFEEMRFAGRLLTNDWRYYDHNTVVFQPRNMTSAELQTGKTFARDKFYSIPSVFRRLWGNLHHPLIYLATNYGHMRQVKVEKKYLNSLLAISKQWEQPGTVPPAILDAAMLPLSQ